MIGMAIAGGPINQSSAPRSTVTGSKPQTPTLASEPWRNTRRSTGVGLGGVPPPSSVGEEGKCLAEGIGGFIKRTLYRARHNVTQLRGGGPLFLISFLIVKNKFLAR